MRSTLFVSALVALAGAVALAVALLGGSDSEETAGRTTRPAATTPAQTGTVERTVPVAPGARVAAGRFILWAVSTTATRADLARSWELVHPDLRAECGCTRQDWLSGNIPIQPYPVKDLETASFAIDESYRDRVVLQVALLPKDGARVEGQIFFIGLQRETGGKRRWLVDYWAPRQGGEQGVYVSPESG